MERRAWGQPRPREPLGRSGGLCSACAVRILRRFFAELGWIASRRGVATSLAGLSRARAVSGGRRSGRGFFPAHLFPARTGGATRRARV